MSSDITDSQIDAYRAAFSADPSARVAQNAVCGRDVQSLSLSRQQVQSMDDSFSVKLDAWSVTNQKRSGRCWLFAALNFLRLGTMKKLNVKEFEFSQNWTLFWDKFERANYFFESIIDTADRHIDDRTVAFLLDRPLDDGGQWNMFINIVRKHGLVPQAAMPETQSSSCTRRMNAVLLTLLRAGARDLRRCIDRGGSAVEARSLKDGMLETLKQTNA